MNLFEIAEKYLYDHTEGLNPNELVKYYRVTKTKSLDEAFEVGVASVVDQNKQSLANPISYNKPERKAKIKKILFDFNVRKVINEYASDHDALWRELCKIVPDKQHNVGGAWHSFSQNIITLAIFISDFQNIDEMYAYMETADTIDKRIKLAEDCSKRISQWGFAMTCNWLKDIGLIDYSKADRHLVEITSRIFNRKYTEQQVFRKIAEEAYDSGVTPFVLDRVLYLIGSGDFWLEEHKSIRKSYNGNEDDFIEFAIKELNLPLLSTIDKDEQIINKSNQFLKEEQFMEQRNCNLNNGVKIKMKETIIEEKKKTSDLYELICEWAENKSEEGYLNFERYLCGEKYVRYRTNELTKLIPDNKNSNTNWNGPYHYFYEIIVSGSRIGLQLAFSYKNISDETKNVCETILRQYSKNPRRNDGNYRWPCTFNSVNVKNMDDVEIFEKMDALFNQMLGYESLVVYNLKKM